MSAFPSDAPEDPQIGLDGLERGDLRSRPAAKSASAFRTISEVSTELDVPQHVLRFWETKFPQVRPLKRGGGRRYYRPEDVELLRHIQRLLHKEGYTIKGVQRLLRESRGHLTEETRLEDAAEDETQLIQTPAPPVTDAQASRIPELSPLPPPALLGLSPVQRSLVESVLNEMKQLRNLLRRH